MIYKKEKSCILGNNWKLKIRILSIFFSKDREFTTEFSLEKNVFRKMDKKIRWNLQ